MVETDDFAVANRPRLDGRGSPRADFDTIYPLAGPIHVAGASWRCARRRAARLRAARLGWAAILPASSAAPGELDDPYLRFFDLTEGDTTELVPGVRIPLEPFLGTTGVPGAGMHDVPIPPPHAGGGNIDLRHLTEGTTLYLPVGAPGALLSLGDGHGAQGDGEVCVSGLECQMRTTIRVSVERGMTVRTPALRRPPGSLTPRVDSGGWFATTGSKATSWMRPAPLCGE